ncbi:MAG: RecQ family ATP-dependent DNA helicase [Acidimicrobiaceae bacterium]|nr:RecQ family ATP-dependent DNA helicase [Acidimicrobiaceae bacterium]
MVTTMRKLLARGSAAPLHPDAERRLLEAAGLASKLGGAESPGDLAPRLTEPPTLTKDAFSVPVGEEVVFDSDLTDPNSHGSEDAFVEWVGTQAPFATRWLTPQPALDALLKGCGHTDSQESTDFDSTEGRRCDFLFAPPGEPALVFEIDGRQHEHQKETDSLRDQQLHSVGIETIRVPVSELNIGYGDSLMAVAEQLERFKTGTSRIEPLVWAPIQTHRLVLGICEAIDAGWLSGDRWQIEIDDPTGLAVDLVEAYLGVLDALDCLWGDRSVAPSEVEFIQSDGQCAYARTAIGNYKQVPFIQQREDCTSDVRILLECSRTPCEPLPHHDDLPTVVIRPTGVPVRIADEMSRELIRRAAFSSCEGIDDQRSAIETLLRAVFAKKQLRDGQFEAITEVLAGRDCMVLLPTGAGKSMIYQLAGLCLPGTTLVVDPLVALMQDQVDGLRAHGIDRATAIQAATKNMPREAGDSYFIFVTPERLQRQQFRNELTAASETAPVNLAVVDEAHCVSEWGHDFRTAYLNFGETLRQSCKGGLGEPPLLALTGTASRPVLKDVLFQLNIEQDRENSVVRPSSFDRKELTYRVVLTKPSARAAALESVLRSMPRSFGSLDGEFWEPTECNDTHSGIIFVQTVGGERGITPTWKQVKKFAPLAVRFSGKAPDGRNKDTWDDDKTRFAQAFKDNRSPVIVTTKAFGMGIDKPNVRWVIHYGLPGSVEAFYQEVGRAGRDGQEAYCVWILTDYDRRENERRLRDGGESPARDDVATALYFHNNSFPPREKEHRCLLNVFDALETDGPQEQIVLSKIGGPDSVKRALHRLAVLSIIDDYCLEGAGFNEAAVVDRCSRHPDDIVQGLLHFVERSAPGRLEKMRADATIEFESLRHAVSHCGRLLIDIVSDTITAARLRSLREMWLMGGEAAEDGEILRNRILDYLTEGDIARQVEKLAEISGFSFEPWQQAWVALSVSDDSPGSESSDEVLGMLVSDSDTREWRSAAARLLGSYPDHPGLLASRALAEARTLGGDLGEFEQNLKQCFARATESYGLSRQQVEQFALWLLDLFTGDTDNEPAASLAAAVLERAERTPSQLAAGVIGAVQEHAIANGEVERWRCAHWHTGTELAVLELARMLDAGCEAASEAVAHIRKDTYARV